MTKGKLLTLFTFLFFIEITVATIPKNDLVIPYQVGLLIFGTNNYPMLFMNFKLFMQSQGKVVETFEKHQG